MAEGDSAARSEAEREDVENAGRRVSERAAAEPRRRPDELLAGVPDATDADKD